MVQFYDCAKLFDAVLRNYKKLGWIRAKTVPDKENHFKIDDIRLRLVGKKIMVLSENERLVNVLPFYRKQSCLYVKISYEGTAEPLQLIHFQNMLDNFMAQKNPIVFRPYKNYMVYKDGKWKYCALILFWKEIRKKLNTLLKRI